MMLFYNFIVFVLFGLRAGYQNWNLWSSHTINNTKKVTMAQDLNLWPSGLSEHYITFLAHLKN